MTKKNLDCGIIMPISEIDGCSESHWQDILSILKDTISEIGFTPNLVSDSLDSGTIQKRIIQNLYDNPIVVCDVSCKNPNVMFELGMRLAFDKPTIIIIDDQTKFSFDTQIIEHIIYPRHYNHQAVKKFKEQLQSKIKNTYNTSQNDKNYTTFLKHFGRFKVATIEDEEISSDKFILMELENINKKIENISTQTSSFNREISGQFYVDLSDFTNDDRLIPFNLSATKNIRHLLDSIFNVLKEYVEPFTYEFDWILVDKINKKPLISMLKKQGAQRGESFQDGRSLQEVNVNENTILMASRIIKTPHNSKLPGKSGFGALLTGN